MSERTTPIGLACRDLLLCLAICGAVAIMSHGAALTNPVRLGILLFVIIVVPTGNFFMYRRRLRKLG
jgi:hypothetical protein